MLCVENLCNDDAEEAIVDMLPKNIALGKENENCVVLVSTLPYRVAIFYAVPKKQYRPKVY